MLLLECFRRLKMVKGDTQGKLRPDLITLDHLTENARVVPRARLGIAKPQVVQTDVAA